MVAVLAVSLPASAQSKTEATCAAEEGKPIAGPKGFTFCSEPARIDNPALGGLQEGVRIAAVEPGSEAAEAGFQAGDIAYRIGGAPVNTGAAAVKRIESLRPGEEAVINFWRGQLPFLIRIRG